MDASLIEIRAEMQKPGQCQFLCQFFSCVIDELPNVDLKEKKSTVFS